MHFALKHKNSLINWNSIMDANLRSPDVGTIIGEDLEGPVLNNMAIKKIEDALRKGIEGHRAGHLELAGDIYETIIKLQPNNSDANHNMGLLKVDQGNALEALPYFETALVTDTSNFIFWASFLQTLIKLGRADEAQNILALAHQGLDDKEFKELDQLLNIRLSDNISYNLTLAGTLPSEEKNTSFNGLISPAVNKNIYRQSIIKNPDCAETHFKNGVTFFGEGDLDAAVDSYQKVLKIDPSRHEAYNNLGSALHAKGNLDAAVKNFKKALKINPRSAETHNNMGTIQKAKGNLGAAIISYKRAIKIEPSLAAPYCNIGTCLKELNKQNEAIKFHKKALKLDPNNGTYQHALAALTGKKTMSAPKDFIENLFDNYATNYDDSLVKKLEYRTPKLIADLILNYPFSVSLGSILDLGCGTGLAGVELRGLCQNIEGIDLSQRMLTKAKQKNIYDKLNHTGILKYLSEAELDFDLFVAADVFIYVGELSEVFRLINSRNKRKGWLVFSTEDSENDGFFLEKSGRYSHSKAYIESLCMDFDYKLLHFSKTVLRKNKGKFVTGGLYLLEF